MAGKPRFRHLGCSFSGCDKEYKAKGYCEYHYFNYYHPYVLKQKICNDEDCSNLARVKGLCEKHYRRQYRAAGGA